MSQMNEVSCPSCGKIFFVSPTDSFGDVVDSGSVHARKHDSMTFSKAMRHVCKQFNLIAGVEL